MRPNDNQLAHSVPFNSLNKWQHFVSQSAMTGPGNLKICNKPPWLSSRASGISNEEALCDVSQ